jgi:hypothetical protein
VHLHETQVDENHMIHSVDGSKYYSDRVFFDDLKGGLNPSARRMQPAVSLGKR